VVQLEIPPGCVVHLTNGMRIHQTLKITPAMAAGVIFMRWEMADMVKVLENWEAANHESTGA